MTERFAPPRGTQDLLPPTSDRLEALAAEAARLARTYGFRRVETPAFEHTELFARGVGETTDIVTKEMYTFEDKGGRSLTLRPEGTAPVVRAYLANRQALPTPFKAYYVVPMFRHERPQAGRMRQHTQFGVEIIGTDAPAADVDVIAVGHRFLVDQGASFTLRLNSIGDPACRPAYREALVAYLDERKDRLPKDVRESLPEETGERLYAKDLPPGALDQVWDMFRRALMPLHSAGKLGVVMFQYPEWFVPSKRSREEILRARERLPDYDIAVELRQRKWFESEEDARKTVGFLRSEGIPFVCVDMPQGFPTSIPPIAEATSDRYAFVRFHGRRSETWGKRGVPVIERFKYDYPDEELEEWVPRVRSLGEGARETHALFNNCYRDYATRNARTFAGLVADD